MQALFLKRRVRREGAVVIDGIVRILVRVVVTTTERSLRRSRVNTTNNNNEEKKKTKSYSYALVTKRTPPRKDLGTFRFADDQMACGVRVDLNESTFVISRVTKTYTLKYGRYVEDEKRRVEVESLERSLLNRQLGDVFKRS